jgi:hypothetical protein
MRLLNQKPLAEFIASTVKLLREPAGPTYRTREAILNDREEFTKCFHRGLYAIHACAIDGIMTVEAKLKRLTMPKESQLAEKRVRQIFRTLNDSIVWTLLPKDPDFWVARLSRGKPRGNLADQNPASVLTFLNQVSASGKKIGIWNDATRCVDLGDVTIFDRAEGIQFLELKQGKVNEAIFETVKTGTVAAIDKFYESFGKKGIEQLDRTVNQEIQAQKHELLLKNEILTDPFTGLDRVAITPSIPASSYDDELRDSLVRVRSSDAVTLTIDECLHLLIINAERCNRSKGQPLVKEYFSRMVAKPQDDEADPCRAVMDFLYGFSLPTSMPVFLRLFHAEDISRLCMGDVQIYYCFDFNTWGKKLKTVQFKWTSQKEGRQERSKPFENRLLLIDDRIPYIVNTNGEPIYFGGQFFLKLLFQGLRPDYLAAVYDESPANLDTEKPDKKQHS